MASPAVQEMRMALPAIVSALAVLIAGACVVSLHHLGPQSTHMSTHIALMNVAAPLFAAWVAHRLPTMVARPATLGIATCAQIVLLWAWHAPSMQRVAMEQQALQVVMHGTLFLAAFLFWSAVLRLPAPKRWHAIPALLLTGKLACLLSALLIFAPRLLHDLPGHDATSLEDQQLAGLLMITACPLSYIVASVILAAQSIGDLARISGSGSISAVR